MSMLVRTRILEIFLPEAIHILNRITSILIKATDKNKR